MLPNWISTITPFPVHQVKTLHKTIISILQHENLLQRIPVECQKLTGGVSSDLYLISDGVSKYVVKLAREKLLVKDEWFADTIRNQIERKFAQYVRSFLPDAVPEILYVNEEHHFFAMEYLDTSFDNWKKQLLEQKYSLETARRAAELLARLHLHTWCNREAEEKFGSNKFFRELRAEPYLVTTGNRNPRFKEIFYQEAERLENWREALVHGDFSPKNIMVGPEHVVLLDHEVASFGDPAFDVAFLLNHLRLKQLVHVCDLQQVPDLAGEVWSRYYEMLGEEKVVPMARRTGRLLLLLMLARIDGKSPVEYLTDRQKEFVRNFVYTSLENQLSHLSEVDWAWNNQLKKANH